jgi:hypothetical protein
VVQAATRRAASVLAWLRSFQVLSFVCIVLDAFRVMADVPSMAIVTHAIARSLPALGTLCLVFGTMMAAMGVLLYASSPANERLTRIDLLTGYMFNALVAGVLLTLPAISAIVIGTVESA